MLVTELGISMLVKLLQSANALSPILVMVFGTLLLGHPIFNVLLLVELMALQLSRES